MLVIVACGGSGTRMAPGTRFVNKHLLPVGQGELMVDMPLKFLAKHQVKEVAIVTGTNHASQVSDYIADGENYGFDLVEYFVQPKPAGIADVLKRVAHRNINEGVLLLLGDNYFELMQDTVLWVTETPNFAAAWEFDIGSLEQAKRFGQAGRGKSGNIIDIVEKPSDPTHTKILTGLYYFPTDVFEYVRKLSPSARGELEITHLLQLYLQSKRLVVHEVDGQWCDLGEDETWMKFVASRTESK